MNPDLTREFPDLTRAARIKTPSSHPKLAKTQTRQLTATPRQAACKTSALTGRKIAKNTWQPKCGQSACSRSADDAAPRSTVRGKPAYATGATPGPAPALVRRRPRRTSRRAKRPSPQPCRRRGREDDGQDPRRRRAECSVATAPRNGVAQPAPRSRARVKAAAFEG